MEIKNTRDYDVVPTINMLVYGRGGTGKSTFGSTFPKPLFLDFENGVKYFKQRGIEVPVIQFDKFPTHEEQAKLVAYAKADSFETIVIDPIGEAMEKLIKDTDLVGGSKYRQSGGEPTMTGWGKIKDEMRSFLKGMRDTGKNVVITAHTTEVQDGETLKQRPLLATKLVDELIAMVDIVGYLDVVKDSEGEEKRVIRVNPSDDKFDAKDRTGALPTLIKPEYEWIKNQIVENVPESATPSNPSKNEPQEAETPKEDTTTDEAPQDAQTATQEQPETPSEEEPKVEGGRFDGMSGKELKALAKGMDIKVPANATKGAIIKLLTNK